MRIAYVSDQFLPQTATDTEQSMSMVSAMASAGAQVTLVVPRRLGKPAPSAAELAKYYQVEPNFEVSAVPLPWTWPRRLAKVTHGICGVLAGAAAASDVLYTRNLPVVVAATALRRGSIVYETYRPWPDQSPNMRRLLGGLAKRGAIDRLVLHSEFAAESFARVGFPRERILVAHNGWDPKRLQPRLDQAAAREHCGLPQGSPIVAYAGRMLAHKGLSVVLQMARTLPHIRFVLVGSETADGPVEREAAGLPNVIVRPWLSFDAVVPYLYAADVLLIPPTLDPLRKKGTTVLPMKTFLYMATARAILAPDGPDLREVLRDGHNAVLVPPDDPPAAVQRLATLVASPETCRRLGAQAFADVEHGTWADRAAAVLEFIRSSKEEE